VFPELLGTMTGEAFVLAKSSNAALNGESRSGYSRTGVPQQKDHVGRARLRVQLFVEQYACKSASPEFEDTLRSIADFKLSPTDRGLRSTSLCEGKAEVARKRRPQSGSRDMEASQVPLAVEALP
jgi:hypothetical protein